MKFSLFALNLVVLFALVACGSSESETAQNQTTNALNDLEKELNEASNTSSEWVTLDTDPLFSIDLPSQMMPEPGLNPDADIQYAYVMQTPTQVLEHYVIVMSERKDSIESYNLDIEYDVKNYSEMSVANLGGTLEEFELLNPDAEVEKINGTDCIISQMTGRLGEVKVYYQFAVFEGKHAFYQVLTWTLDHQKEEFIGDMDTIIHSFREK